MIHIANVVHQSGPDAGHPFWDTLIALRSIAGIPVTCRIQIRNDNGSVVMWPHFDGSGSDPYVDITIQPGRMWAASFIPGNGFTAAEGASAGTPQDFAGSATIECLNGVDDGNILPFVLAANQAWKYGVNIPVLKDDHPQPALAPQSIWRCAYVIPNFDDRQGDTGKLWETGVEIVNRSAAPVLATVGYYVGQNYAESGQWYGFSLTVPANGSARFDLLRGNAAQGVPGLLNSGYPANRNSEGALDITASSPVLLQPSLIIASSDYSFTVGEDFQ